MWKRSRVNSVMFSLIASFQPGLSSENIVQLFIFMAEGMSYKTREMWSWNNLKTILQPVSHLCFIKRLRLQSCECPNIVLLDLAKIPILIIQNRSRGGHVILKVLSKSFCTWKELMLVLFGTEK